jgi:hypothetical protein
MRYIMMAKATPDYEAGLPPKAELMAGMRKLTEEMIQAGILLAAERLEPSSQGARVKYSDGKRAVTDGPFAETKELIGGFAIFEAKSKQEAIELAERAVEAHVQAGISQVEIEIRLLSNLPSLDPDLN